ncbi:hypothetical protein LBMAG53_28140 [Planctomycetota bacterium]|nr:hypothetical protein LBMAG53_28140 [Planctomycetota bacterium]
MSSYARRTVGLATLSGLILCTGRLSAADGDISEWEEIQRQRQEYTDVRVSLLVMPATGTLAIDTHVPRRKFNPDDEGPGQTRGTEREDVTVSLRERIRGQVGLTHSNGNDRGNGVGVVGLSLGYQSLSVDKSGGEHRGTTKFQSILVDGDLAWAFHPVSTSSWQIEFAALAGAGGSYISRDRTVSASDEAGVTVKTAPIDGKGWGWAYEVGLRAGMIFTLPGGWQVAGDVRYLYFQTSGEDTYTDPTWGVGKTKDTLTLNGLSFSLSTGWRF